MRQQDFNDHPVWPSIENALEALRTTEADAPEGEADARDRIRFVGALVQSYGEIEAALFNRSMLDQVQQLWDQVGSCIQNSRDVESARTVADNSLSNIGTWPQPVAKGGAVAKANQLLKAYAAEAEKALSEVKRSYAQNLSQAESERLRLEGIITEMQSELSRLTTQVEAQATKITSDEARLDTALTTNTRYSPPPRRSERRPTGGGLTSGRTRSSSRCSPTLTTWPG